MAKIIDYISGLEVNSGPEELEATQPFSKILVEDYGYPKDQIQTRPQFRTSKRPSDEIGSYPVDIAIFKSKKKTDETLFIIVECKHKDEKTGIKELKKYLSLSNASLGVWYNGKDIRFIQKLVKKGGINFRDLPNIPLCGQEIEDIGSQTKNTLTPAKNLKTIFKNIRSYIAGNSTGVRKPEIVAYNIINMVFAKIYDERFSKPDALLSFRASNDEKDFEVSKRIKKIFEEVKKRYSDVFNSSDEISLDNQTIKYVVGRLQNYTLINTSRDAVAEAFEILIGPTLKGESGQFFTPRNVVSLIVSLIGVEPNSLVIDPACGTGGFLTEVLKTKWNKIDIEGKKLGWSQEAIKEEKNHSAIKTIFGIENDDFIAKVAKAYMAILGDGRGSIHTDNTLKNPEDWNDKTKTDIQLNKFDIVLANPPFGEDIKVTGEDLLSQYDLAKSNNGKIKKEMRPDILFLERCVDLAKDGAKIGIVLIETYLHGKNSKIIRDFLSNHNIMWVCDLPHNTFRPFCNAKTVFVIFQKKTKQQKKINFIVAEQMGHDHRGEPIFKWNKKNNIVDSENLWDDLSEVNKSIKENKEDIRVFKIDQKYIYEKDISVPRYFWKSKDLEIENYCKKNKIKLIPISQLIDEKIITTFDGHGSPPSQNKGKGDLPYIRVKDIVNWGIYKDNTAAVPSELYNKFVLKEKILKQEDILFVKRGSYRIGSVAMISPSDQEMILTKEIQVIRLTNKTNEYDLSSFYLLYCFSSKIVQDQLYNKILIETTLPNISDRWKDLKIPIYEKKIFNDISKRMRDIFLSQRWKSSDDISKLAEKYGKLVT